MAWIIIIGDAIHNFADGITLGAAISQSLSLGLSTTIAVVLHEVPHELGKFEGLAAINIIARDVYELHSQLQYLLTL